jgi:hypothetical protein
MNAVFDADRLVRPYLIAKRTVLDAGYASEVGWQAALAQTRVTSGSFVEQAAWVVLSAGLSERIVRRCFPLISTALFDFDLQRVVREPSCRDAALAAFGHERKIDAILTIATWAYQAGDQALEAVVDAGDEECLMRLPYIGPATVRHLLKNLGKPVAKPDRHLARLAVRFDCSVEELCRTIATRMNDPVGVVDVVLWRWSALHAAVCREECDGLPHPLRV